MFQHEFVDIDFGDIVVEEKIHEESGNEYKRYYYNEQQLPSISKVLELQNREFIEKWRQRVGEEEADKITRMSSARGTAVHDVVEKYLLNESDWAKGATPATLERFGGIRPELDKLTNICGIEVDLASKHLMLNGRADCIAKYNGILSAIDFKTSAKWKRANWLGSYYKQQCAYAIMWEELTGQPITQLVTIMSVDPDNCQVFIEHRDNWAQELLDNIAEYQKSLQNQ